MRGGGLRINFHLDGQSGLSGQAFLVGASLIPQQQRDFDLALAVFVEKSAPCQKSHRALERFDVEVEVRVELDGWFRLVKLEGEATLSSPSLMVVGVGPAAGLVSA